MAGVPNPVEDAAGEARLSESDRGMLGGAAEYDEPRRMSMPFRPPPERRPLLEVDGRGRPRESVWLSALLL